jgi:hypothetical protein
MRHSAAVSLVLVTAIALAAGAAAEVPVVAAVDSSRSLSAADLATVRASFAELLERLPPGTPSGLLTFDDEVRWLVPPGGAPGRVLEALGEVTPRGRFTVLNDALFTAARELEGGGVVVVVTDGRDEGSATIPEDVARMCDTNGVRLVVAGLGRRHDGRALRRLALITRGELVERLDLTPDGVPPAVERARGGVVADLAAAAPPPTPPPATPTEVAAAAPSPATPSWVLPVLGLLAVMALGLLAALWLALKRREPERSSCERCGAPLEPWETSCSRCQIAELEEALKAQQVAGPAVAVEAEEVALDPEVFRKSPLPEGLANTLVLDEEPVLIARQRGRSARTYNLPKDRAFAVGRAPGVNSLQIDDPTVSAQHFRVVPKDGEFYVVDLDTTNGTLVNHQRVTVRKLASGDVIQVGSVQLEFALQLRRLG